MSRRPGTRGSAQAQAENSNTAATNRSSSDSDEATSPDASSGEGSKSREGDKSVDAGIRSRSGGGSAQLSPVEHTARELGIRPANILCPASAKEVRENMSGHFLINLRCFIFRTVAVLDMTTQKAGLMGVLLL